MTHQVEFTIAYAYPPWREGRVIQLYISHDGSVDIPVEVYRDDGETVITLFSRPEGLTYVAEDFVAAINAAVAALEGPPPEWSKATP